jgi:hypothetical protein
MTNLIKKYQLKKIDKKTQVNWVNPSNSWHGSWDCDNKKKKQTTTSYEVVE